MGPIGQFEVGGDEDEHDQSLQQQSSNVSVNHGVAGSRHIERYQERAPDRQGPPQPNSKVSYFTQVNTLPSCICLIVQDRKWWLQCSVSCEHEAADLKRPT